MFESLVVVDAKGMEPSARAHFIFERLVGNKSATTRLGYESDARNFAGFLNCPSTDQALAALLSLDQGTVNALVETYRDSMSSFAPATVRRRLSMLGSFAKEARRLGVVNWFVDVDAPRLIAYKDTAGPGVEGVRRMLGRILPLALQGNVKAVRDRAIVHLLFSMALRRAELASLDVDSIDMVNGKLSVVGKGRTEPIKLTMPDGCKEALKAWLDVRGITPGALFVGLDSNQQGTRLSVRSIDRIIAKLGERVGLTVRPHGLRHSGITYALQLFQGNFEIVRAYSRHFKVDTVLIYDDNLADMNGQVAKEVSKGLIGL